MKLNSKEAVALLQKAFGQLDNLISHIQMDDEIPKSREFQNMCDRLTEAHVWASGYSKLVLHLESEKENKPDIKVEN